MKCKTATCDEPRAYGAYFCSTCQPNLDALRRRKRVEANRKYWAKYSALIGHRKYWFKAP